MSRPIFRTNGAPAIYAGIDIDFNISDTSAPLTTTPVEYGRWDVNTWDNSQWGGGLQVLQNWQGIHGVGYYAAPIVKAASNGIELRWVSTDIVMEGGGIL